MKAISITPGIPEVRVTEFPEPELESPRVFPLCREEGWDKYAEPP